MGLRSQPCIAIGLALPGMRSWGTSWEHFFSTSGMPWVFRNHRCLGRGFCRGIELADIEHPQLGFAENNILLLIGFNGIHKRDICPILGLIYLKSWDSSLRSGKMFCLAFLGFFFFFL